eukprot:164296-Pyramimonas_sp.AAC.1
MSYQVGTAGLLMYGLINTIVNVPVMLSFRCDACATIACLLCDACVTLACLLCDACVTLACPLCDACVTLACLLCDACVTLACLLCDACVTRVCNTLRALRILQQDHLQQRLLPSARRRPRQAGHGVRRGALRRLLPLFRAALRRRSGRARNGH